MQILQKCLFQQYELDQLLVDDNGVTGERIYRNDDGNVGDSNNSNNDHADDDKDDERSAYIVMHKLRVYRVPEH